MSAIKITEDNQMSSISEGLLNNALKEIMTAVRAECGSLFLFDLKNKELVLGSFHNSGNLNVRGLRQGIGEGISGKVAQAKIPVLVKDINFEERFRRNGYNHYHTSSFICIPLISSHGLIGVINIADKSDGQPFEEKDLNFAVTICKYACMAYDGLNSCRELDKQKSLLEKYASMGKLAAGVVHEINNPLDGVIRYANILLEQTEHNSAAREYLLEAKRGLNRIANITKSLLEFSHQVNLSAAQAKKYIDMHLLINEALDFATERTNANIRLEKRYRAGLPRILDIGIAHVFINLINNALDSMPQQGVLEIVTDLRESEVLISFKDSGSGIADEVKEHIFEPFFTTKSIDKGTGLGLAICSEIISKYEGRIELESSPGEGSKFTILIPKKFLENG